MEWEPLTKRQPNHSQWQDIEWGWQTAQSLNRFGVARSIHIKNRAILAVETVEGLTDAIHRSGVICRGGFSVLLSFTPNTGDPLLPDEPINRRILQALVDARASVLALDADYPIARPEQLLPFADRQKIAVVRVR